MASGQGSGGASRSCQEIQGACSDTHGENRREGSNRYNSRRRGNPEAKREKRRREKTELQLDDKTPNDHVSDDEPRPYDQRSHEASTTNSGQKKPAGKAELKQDSRKWERNLLSMVGASIGCQTTTHLGYSWCVTLLTTVAIGVQGQEEQEPRTDQGRVSWDMEEEGGTSEQITPKRESEQCDRMIGWRFKWHKQKEALYS